MTRSVHQEALDLLTAHFDVEVWASDEVVPRDELLKQVKGADAIFCTISDRIDAEVLDAAGWCVIFP